MLFCIITLNPLPITETSKFCGNRNNFCDKAASQSTPEAPSSDFIFSNDTGMLRILRSSQEKTYKTCSHHTNQEMFLSNMEVKTPIAGAN